MKNKTIMFNKFVLTILFFALFIYQSKSQSINNLKEINKVWEEFYKAFDSLDYRLMAEIHSKKLIRISGGQNITDYETYINNYKAQFNRAKNNNVSNSISLRFFERINNDSIASERGIYKLTRIENKQGKQAYYGQFHVLFRKENNQWKILMDYDSNEENTINEENFMKAYSINEFNRFTQN